MSLLNNKKGGRTPGMPRTPQSLSERAPLTHHMKREKADCCHVMHELSKLADADVTSPTTERAPLTVKLG